MTREEILNGNKLIIEYLGGILEPGTSIYRLGGKLYEILYFKYHESMDWLLPVINKIKQEEEFSMISDDEGWEIEIVTTGYYYMTQSHKKNSDLVEGCWEACVEYAERVKNNTIRIAKK